MIFKGYIIACTGDPVTGIQLITGGLAIYEATGSVAHTCLFRALLAEVLAT